MKKKYLILFLILALAASLCMAVAVGCAGNRLYVVTVTGGTGSGEYEAGAECTVTAELGEDEVFVKWTDAFGEAVSENNPYVFKVESDVALVAVTKTVVKPPEIKPEDPPVTKYGVTVEGGIITGTELTEASFEEGASVSVTALETSAKRFNHWLVNDAETVTENPYVFTIRADVTLKAVFDETCLIVVEGGTVGGEKSAKIASGEECTITANEPEEGKSFVYWYVLDENGEEREVSRSGVYTFTVTESEKFYAKFGEVFTVTVIGGYLNGDVNLTSADFEEGESCTVSLNYDEIPQDKGFTGWRIDGADVSAEHEFRIANITRSVSVEAVYGDLVHGFITPEMSANQMFKWENTNYQAIAIDRSSVGTAFTDHAEYVVFYMYTTPYANIEDYVGAFMIDLKGDTNPKGYTNTVGYRLATLEGETLWELESNKKGNAWLNTVNGFNHNGRQNLGKIFKGALGDNYSAQTPYYLACQVFGLKGSVYAPGEASQIGPMAFIEDAAVAACEVTVENGVITGTQLTSATLYAGQSVSVTFTAELEEGQIFRYWLVNGEKGAETQTAEIIVNAKTTIVGVIGVPCDITVNNGTVKDGGATANIMAGDECTIVATEDGENVFAYWYVTDGASEKYVADTAEYTFVVTKTETYFVKYVKDLAVLSAPSMEGNAMFKHNADYSLLELDRGASGTAFTEGVDYVKFYVYTSTDADKSQPVAVFIMDNKTITGVAYNFRLATVEGKTLLHIEGRPKPDGSGMGNCWVQSVTQPNGQGYNANYFFEIFKEILGDAYDPDQEYFLAAQRVAVKGSGYADSEISEIGTMAFKVN